MCKCEAQFYMYPGTKNWLKKYLEIAHIALNLETSVKGLTNIHYPGYVNNHKDFWPQPKA